MLENLKNTSLWIFEVQSEGYLLSGSGVNVVFKFSTLPTGRPDMKINRGASEKDMDISESLAQQSLAGHSWEVGSRVYSPISCHILLSVEPQFKAKSFTCYCKVSFQYVFTTVSWISIDTAHTHAYSPWYPFQHILSRKQKRHDPPEQKTKEGRPTGGGMGQTRFGGCSSPRVDACLTFQLWALTPLESSLFLPFLSVSVRSYRRIIWKNTTEREVQKSTPA